MRVVTHSLQEFMTEAVRLARMLTPREKRATIVALSGDLGAGKTTFVQAMAKEFGVVDLVNSPTFVIEKVYACESGPYRHLVHMDAYRIKGVHELKALGWDEVITDADNLVLVEWPENIEGAIPTDAAHVKLAGEGDERAIEIINTYGEK